MSRKLLLRPTQSSLGNETNIKLFDLFRDYHFTNCRNILKPEFSVHTKTDFRKKLKPGPGVDAVYGTQLPIPQELLMTRGEAKKKKPKNKGDNLKEKKVDVKK